MQGMFLVAKLLNGVGVPAEHFQTEVVVIRARQIQIEPDQCPARLKQFARQLISQFDAVDANL
jgi:hypothetical protein